MNFGIIIALALLLSTLRKPFMEWLNKFEDKFNRKQK